MRVNQARLHRIHQAVYALVPASCLTGHGRYTWLPWPQRVIVPRLLAA
jgi:hypothetical protein